MSKKLFLMVLVTLLVTVGFSWFFVGMEMMTGMFPEEPPLDDGSWEEEPPEEEPPLGPAPGEFALFPAEVFARVDLGPIYFMLPVGVIDRNMQFNLNPAIENSDYEQLLKLLGVGISLRADLFGFYIKAAADMPVMAWMDTATNEVKHLFIKLGVGTKILILAVEGGMLYSIDVFDSEIYGGSFGQFFIAAGLAF